MHFLGKGKVAFYYLVAHKLGFLFSKFPSMDNKPKVKQLFLAADLPL